MNVTVTPGEAGTVHLCLFVSETAADGNPRPGAGLAYF